ncbi:deoxyribodipyrimidine photolyase [Pseudoalteromonas sp. SW0106-04]|uniref:deoxyribodipyrimidine photo-lyase n=1 Tax=Pseudoalteromonas sp. SW0106-04 TaxID=1702169 RepID=UPI0006B429DD|nr:deoxyribodipyrimidine photo-lyase [Pseudoalteromonas sp. SW0106-04]GAP73610.1 deoxyribodipyrimidine photolyase [Pseudoalteromonas sp. SW0106-04]
MSSLFWFRRDLRLYANEALIEALNNGAKDAVFFVCEKQWQRHDMAPIQLDLILRRVDYLGQRLSEHGIRLHVLNVDEFSDIPASLQGLCNSLSVKHIYANREYEVNERQRDSQCAQLALEFRWFDGDVIAPPGSVCTKSGDMFRVFTPFKRQWLKQYEQTHFSLSSWPSLYKAIKWQTPRCIQSDGESQKWPVDDDSLSAIVERFIDDKLTTYEQQRDFPAIKGTSGLSPYLALGVISVKQLLVNVQQRHPDILQSAKSNLFSWVNELIWREFYRHLIVAYPRLCKHANFNAKYDAVKWRQSDKDFNAWCEGKTGYPLVDAAMRQLVQTGWMHNRLRMVVASFLTKHLLIDWRAGEQFFMRHLIDGDLASNNGGWQWAASTGCDAQPYFRIFNPITQSERFDPDGEFIRKYLPELEKVPAKQIHFPHQYLAATQSNRYWPAIVDHKAARERALARFKVDDE